MAVPKTTQTRCIHEWQCAGNTEDYTSTKPYPYIVNPRCARAARVTVVVLCVCVCVCGCLSVCTSARYSGSTQSQVKPKIPCVKCRI